MSALRQVVWMALLLASLPVLAGDAPTYRYRDSESVATSNTRRSIYFTSKVPFDREWSGLSAADQALVRTVYKDLPQADEPPWPNGGLVTVYHEITRLLPNYRNVESGPVMAVARVNERGIVDTVEVYRSPSDAMTSIVSKALIASSFKPARRNGAPATMDFLFDVGFER